MQGPREDSGFNSGVDPGVRLASQVYTYTKKYHPKSQVMASGLRTKDGEYSRRQQSSSIQVHVRLLKERSSNMMCPAELLSWTRFRHTAFKRRELWCAVYVLVVQMLWLLLVVTTLC